MSSSKSSKKNENACKVYDFTLFDDIDKNMIKKSLESLCRKFCFQKEKGEETGKIHFQGRFTLKIKKRKSEIIKLLQEESWKKFHISITSSNNQKNDYYVMKDDTRIEGPWTDEDVEIYIPKDIKKINELKPWQESLRNTLKEYNERTVDIVFDESGNKGKTTLVRYMMLYDDAELLPFCNDYKDIMRMAYDVGPKEIYLVDMPRAINKEKLSQFFSGIETLKSGYCYDDRYKFTKRIFDRPRICIFTNVQPDKSMLSKDMWKIWCINNEEQLVPYIDPIDEFIEEESDVKASKGKKKKAQ